MSGWTYDVEHPPTESAKFSDYPLRFDIDHTYNEVIAYNSKQATVTVKEY